MDFVVDPISFRSQLGSYGAVLAGIFALNVLELSRRRVPYLDIFIENGHSANEFISYLQENEGYQREDMNIETVMEWLHAASKVC